MKNTHLSPILILGSERSGTNLLRALLDAHTQIASPPPAGFMDALGGIQSRYFPEDSPSHLSDLIDDVIVFTKTHLNPWDVDLDANAISAKLKHPSLWEIFKVVNEMYTEKYGQSHWCSKEPGLFKYIYEIANHLPNAKFIYLVRDGRDVATSMLRGHLHEFHAYFASQNWAWAQRLCLNALADPDINARIHLLKYENLIDNPRDTMQELMNFIGLEFEESQLKYYENDKILEHSKKSKFWKNLARPINRNNQGTYRLALGAKNIQIFESVAWSEMEALGYPKINSYKKHFTASDIRLYHTIAFLRKKLWGIDPRREAIKARARSKITRGIINRHTLNTKSGK